MYQVPNISTLKCAQINSNQIIFQKTSNAYKVKRKMNSKMTLLWLITSRHTKVYSDIVGLTPT